MSLSGILDEFESFQKHFFFRFLEPRKKQRKIGIIEISVEISYRFHQNFRNFVPCFYFDDVDYGFAFFTRRRIKLITLQ